MLDVCPPNSDRLMDLTYLSSTELFFLKELPGNKRKFLKSFRFEIISIFCLPSKGWTVDDDEW